MLFGAGQSVVVFFFVDPQYTFKMWWFPGVSWPRSELIRFWSQSGFFFFKFGGGCGVGAVLTLWNGSNLWSPSISGRTHGRNGRKFGMLMYPADHLQIWLDYGHGMLIFLILAQFWLKETGKGRGVKMCEECFLGILMSWIWCRFCRPWTHDCCGWGPNLPTEIYSLA